MRTRAPDSSVVWGNEVTSSNNTLNAFLGGRQKSWMTGDGSLVRPSPRAAVTQKSVAGVLPSPAPSDEPSPPLQQPRETSPSGVHVEVQLPVQGLSRQEYSHGGTIAGFRIIDSLMNAAVPSPNPHNAELESSVSEVSVMPVGIPRDRNSQQVPKRRHMAIPTQQSLPSLKGHIPIIDQHIEFTGQFQALDQGLDRPRFNLLRDACNNQDYFYVALHQVFCLWTTDRELVSGIEGVGDFRAVAIAFQFLSQLVRENDGLSPVHLQWFSQFPSSLTDLIHRSKHYRQALSDVFKFLHKLAADWVPFTTQCQSRGYPPLVDELVYRLGILSPVLQGIFFTATRRNLGFGDDAFGAQMEEVFALDRDGHRALAARYHTAYPPSEREVTERNKGLADQYLAIRNELFQNQPEYLVHQQTPVANSVARESYPAPPVLHQPEHNLLQGSNAGRLSPNQNLTHPATYSGSSVQPRTLSSDETQLQTPVLFVSTENASGQQNEFENRNTQLLSPSLVSPLSGGFQNYALESRSNRNPNLQTSTSMAFPGSVPATQSQPSQFMHPYHQQMMAAQQTQMHQPQMHQTQIHQVQMHQAQMHQAQMHQAQMHQAQMHQAQMQQAQMQQTQMQQAQTQQAQTHQVQTHQTQTHQAQMQQAQSQQTQTYQAQMQQAQMLQQAQIMQQSQLLQARLSQQNAAQQSRVARNDSMLVPVPTENFQSQANDGSAPQRLPSQRSRNGSISGGPLTPISNSSSAQQSFQQASMLSSIPSGQQPAAHPLLQSSVHLRSDRLLIPPSGYVPPHQLPNPDFTSLHQAHLRSPHMVAARPAIQSPSTGRHYQAVKGFVVDPTVLSLDRPLSKFQFMVPAPIYNRLASDKLNTMTSPPTREFIQGTLQLRMRCTEIKRGTKRCDTLDWVVADTVWPPSVFLEINGLVLEVRRKNHHAKDLPVDITPYVIRHGVDQTSRIRISIPRVDKTQKEIKYAFAVEVVEILGHQQILNMCLKKRIPATETLQNIKRSLSGSLDDDDDEIAMVVSDLTVDLADPFMATIFNVPVRGSSCLHRECFDLETFLNTRNSKPRRPDQPCMVDVWKCPLCGNDARPYSLRVDEFLVSVRETLAKDDNLEVKAILVAADGTWKPKPEPLNQKRKSSLAGLSAGFDSDSNDEMEPNIKRRQTEEIEIIDLEED